jgi:hypothetical protein
MRSRVRSRSASATACRLMPSAFILASGERVEAVQTWLAAAEISAGLFRAVGRSGRVSDDALADDSAARIVKRYARRVGLDPASYASHSLRSGFLTSAAESGASIWKLSAQSSHKSLDTLRGSQASHIACSSGDAVSSAAFNTAMSCATWAANSGVLVSGSHNCTRRSPLARSRARCCWTSWVWRLLSDIYYM